MINRDTKKQGLTLMKTENKDKKSSYAKPSLVRYGMMKQVTLGSSGAISDLTLSQN